MKKAILIFSLSLVLAIGNVGLVMSQEKPKPKKDTVNMDTYAKPKQYYAVEDEKAKPAPGKSNGSAKTIIIIAGAAVILGATAFFMLKRKK